MLNCGNQIQAAVGTIEVIVDVVGATSLQRHHANEPIMLVKEIRPDGRRSLNGRRSVA